MKKQWTIILILFLLAANAGLLATLIISNKTMDEKEKYTEKNFHRRNKHEPGRFEQHLSNELGLNKEQITEIKRFSKEFRREKYNNNIKMDRLKKRYFENMSTAHPDTEALKVLADSMGKVQSNLLLLDLRHYRNIRSVCNTEQVKKLDSIGQKRFYIRKHNNENFGSKQKRRHKRSGFHTNNDN